MTHNVFAAEQVMMTDTINNTSATEGILRGEGMTKDSYAYDIAESLREHQLVTDDELAQIRAYLIA